MTRATLALLCLALVAGCALAARTPEMHYYVLAAADDVAVRLQAPVKLGTFTVADPYLTRQIAYRTSPYQLAYYNYHRWAGSPEALVANAVREHLERATRAAGGPPLAVSGHVRRLEEVDDPAGWQGAIALDLTVRLGDAVLLERSYTETEPAGTHNPEAVVAALSRALTRIMEQVVATLAERDA